VYRHKNKPPPGTAPVGDREFHTVWKNSLRRHYPDQVKGFGRLPVSAVIASQHPCFYVRDQYSTRRVLWQDAGRVLAEKNKAARDRSRTAV